MAAAKLRMESDEFRERRRVIEINPDQIGVDQGETEYLVD
jgi:hypothetical protein